MPRIVLHIGTHKTATTTIQRMLYGAREALATRGVFYPDFGLIGKPPRSSQGAAVNGLLHGGAFPREEARRFFRRVAEVSRDHAVTIISAESLYRHVAGSRPGEHAFPDRPAYWKRRTAYVSMIREILGEASVEVAVVFRPQPAYAESLYQEYIKTTASTLRFRPFLETFWYHFDYLQQARTWAAGFGTVRAMRFEDLVRDGAVPAHFGELIGVDLADLPKVSPKNVGSGVDAAILKRQLNPLQDGTLHKQIKARLKELPENARLALRRRSFFDGADHLAQFGREFEPANALLKAEFLPTLPTGPLFSDNYDIDLAFGDEMDPRFLHLLFVEGRPRWSSLPGRIQRLVGRFLTRAKA